MTLKLLVLIVLTLPENTQCDGDAAQIPPDLVLERFTVSKYGGPLLVPVRVAEKEYLFIVDTGASHTAFDTSIPLGQPFQVATVNGAEGKTELKLYRPPESKVGRTSLGPLDAVAGMDFSSMRQFTGVDIRGILGMDFLGRYVVHIDIENGKLLLLKSAPKRCRN